MQPHAWAYEAHHASLSMEFSRQAYWSGLPFPTPGNLPDPGIKPRFPALAGGFFITEPLGSPQLDMHVYTSQECISLKPKLLVYSSPHFLFRNQVFFGLWACFCFVNNTFVPYFFGSTWKWYQACLSLSYFPSMAISRSALVTANGIISCFYIVE